MKNPQNPTAVRFNSYFNFSFGEVLLLGRCSLKKFIYDNLSSPPKCWLCCEGQEEQMEGVRLPKSFPSLGNKIHLLKLKNKKIKNIIRIKMLLLWDAFSHVDFILSGSKCLLWRDSIFEVYCVWLLKKSITTFFFKLCS